MCRMGREGALRVNIMASKRVGGSLEGGEPVNTLSVRSAERVCGGRGVRKRCAQWR